MYKRVLKALDLTVTPLGDRRYRVEGGAEAHYVDGHHPDHPCDCPDRAQPHCKHVFAVMMHKAGIQQAWKRATQHLEAA